MIKKIFGYFPYYIWLVFFVGLPILFLFIQSLSNNNKNFTFENYSQILSSPMYLKMMINSFFYAFLITLFTFIISYPVALFLTRLKNSELFSLLVVVPSWFNILLKTYAFIGILSFNGPVNKLLNMIGFGYHHLLFTDMSFILIASYIELPFMILPIFDSINKIDKNIINASEDLGANEWDKVKNIIFPLSMPGIQSGIQSVFIPSLSLFMLTRLIAGNNVITMGTAIEENFMVTLNWGLGATLGIILIIIMFVLMFIFDSKKRSKNV